MKTVLPLLMVVFLVTGCTSTSITNLTPSKLPRSEDGLYLFEAQWDSNQQSIIKDSIQGHVVIGMDKYPMERVPQVRNRWETYIPIPADQKYIHYRYRFDFDYRGIPVRRHNSKLSPTYYLEIID